MPYIIIGIILFAFAFWYVQAAIQFPIIVIPIVIALVVAGITWAILASLDSESRRIRIRDNLKRNTRSEYEHALEMDAELEKENKRIIAENKRKAEQKRQENIERKKQLEEENKEKLSNLKKQLAECEKRINECDIIGERFKNYSVMDYLISKLEDNMIGSAREGLNMYDAEQKKINKEIADFQWQLLQDKMERKRREQAEWEQLERDAKTWDKQNEIIKNQEKILQEINKNK